MLYFLRWVNGCGDSAEVLVDVPEGQLQLASGLAKNAMAQNPKCQYLNCHELESIEPFKPALENENGTVLFVDAVDHETDGII